MEHALSEWSYLIRFHPSYAWARSFLASNTRDRFLLAESAIFPIMSQRSAPTWYALTVNNWVTPSGTVKKRSSAVFAKRMATTLSIVNYLVGGALKKLTLVVVVLLLLLPLQSPDHHSLSRSLLLMSLLLMARLLQFLYRSLYLMFLLHSLLCSLLLMYLLHLSVFSSHRNHHRRHLLVSLHHCPRTPQSSPPHSFRSLRSLQSSFSRLSPSFHLLNHRPCLFLS